MNHFFRLSLASTLLLAPMAQAHVSDDPFLTKVLIDSLEYYHEGHEQGLAWDVEAWAGWDLRKFWLETEGARNRDGDAEWQVEAAYGLAIAPYWDAQLGWRHDFRLHKDQDWLLLGLQGLAPYFFESEVNFYLDPDGATALSLEAERELLLTQRWVLSPEVELLAYGQNDAERGQGSGLAGIEAGVRLRYEITREFAPYLGVTWERSLGNTADLRLDSGEHKEEVLWSVGIQAWF